MNIGYAIALVVLAFAVGLLAFGTASGEHVSLLGLTVHSSVARGVGLVSVIFSIIAFLVAYGSSLPPVRAERRK